MSMAAWTVFWFTQAHEQLWVLVLHLTAFSDGVSRENEINFSICFVCRRWKRCRVVWRREEVKISFVFGSILRTSMCDTRHTCAVEMLQKEVKIIRKAKVTNRVFFMCVSQAHGRRSLAHKFCARDFKHLFFAWQIKPHRRSFCGCCWHVPELKRLCWCCRAFSDVTKQSPSDPNTTKLLTS